MSDVFVDRGTAASTAQLIYEREYTSRFPVAEHAKLKHALDAATIPGGHLPVFARDLCARGGSKSYYVFSYRHFMEYARVFPTLNHWYEILRSPCPTDAYFDLELDLRFNPDFDHRAFRSAFECAVKDYVTAVGFDSPLCIWAYSCSDIKFSAHVRVIIRGNAFAGPESVGIFFHGLDVSGFSCNTAEGDGKGNIVDSGVYTRNRNFRLAYASKFSDPLRILVPEEGTCTSLTPSAGWIRDKRAFLGMLLQRQACAAERLISLLDISHKRLSAITRHLVGEAHNLIPNPKTTYAESLSSSLTLGEGTASQALIALLKSGISSTPPWKGVSLEACGHSANFNVIYFRSDSRTCKLAERVHRSNHVRFSATLSPVPFFRQSCHSTKNSACMGYTNAFTLPDGNTILSAVTNWHESRGRGSVYLSRANSNSNSSSSSSSVPADCMF